MNEGTRRRSWLTPARRRLKALLGRLPGGSRMVQWLVFLRARAGTSSAKEIFTRYYEHNYWRNRESRSGAGSTLDYTANIRQRVPELIAQLQVTSVLDAPCGDYHWFAHVARPAHVQYVGGDIVASMVADCQRRYGNANTRFVELDITADSLPKVDLWLCRDVLFHLSNQDIFRALENLLASDIQWLLTSTHPECARNSDVPTGHFRLLNLRLPPFALPPPITEIDDWIAGYPVRKLALWRVQALREALATNPALTRS